MAKRRKNTVPETAVVEEASVVKEEVVLAEEPAPEVEETPAVKEEVVLTETPVKPKKEIKKPSKSLKELVLERGKTYKHNGDSCIFVETRGSKVIIRKGLAFSLVERDSLEMP